jgi:hypothetical protein
VSFHQPDNKPLIEVDIYFALSDPSLCESVRGTANELARRRPFSKYGIEASIHAHPEEELDLHTLALPADDLLYVYEDLRAHRYTKILTAGQWKAALRRKHKAASSPPLLANSAVLLPGRYTSNLLDMSAVVAKRRVIRYALKRHGNDLEQTATGLGVNLYTLLKEIRLLHLPLPPDIPEEQRALVTAAKLINPAAWDPDEKSEEFDEDTLEETDAGATRGTL